MARTSTVRRARGTLIALMIVIIGMGGLLAYGVNQDRAQWSPLLALDLEGGTQLVLSPQVESGETIDDEQLEQAVEVIRQRVDGTGVTEAEITTQGAENVVVGMPGVPDDETRQLIQASADMQFRPVLEVGQDQEYIEELMDEELSEEEREALEEQDAATEDEDQEGEASPDDFPEPEGDPQDHSDPNWVTPELAADFANYTCSRDVSAEDRAEASNDEPLITCDPETGTTYLLGPVDVEGTHISDASFGSAQSQSGAPTGGWVVTLNLDNEGTEAFAESSTRLTGLTGARNQFAIVLDGHVISAPAMNSAVTDGNAQIEGDFSEDEARQLSEQLRYGSLPISFQIESEQQISATLGQDQLRTGLLTGIIGLVLVAGYAVFQYRALSMVTISSLIVAGVITWWWIALLGWSDGYRLSLAGIAGLIVSIGLTADSFIVYFERIKDELRDGRSLVGAVEAGWARARRTILASKAVNLIAAVVLFIFAVGNVRGFAFTLGLTAIIDVILVFLFTHPVMQLLARKKFFAEGKPFSGLSDKELGATKLYRGAGRFQSGMRGDAALGEPALVGASSAGAAASASPEQAGTRSGVQKAASPRTAVSPAEDPGGPVGTTHAGSPVSAPSADSPARHTEASAPPGQQATADESGMTIAERRRARAQRAADAARDEDESGRAAGTEPAHTDDERTEDEPTDDERTEPEEGER
jgi:preprotein translocase subunit SecD